MQCLLHNILALLHVSPSFSLFLHGGNGAEEHQHQQPYQHLSGSLFSCWPRPHLLWPATLVGSGKHLSKQSVPLVPWQCFVRPLLLSSLAFLEVVCQSHAFVLQILILFALAQLLYKIDIFG